LCDVLSSKNHGCNSCETRCAGATFAVGLSPRWAMIPTATWPSCADLRRKARAEAPLLVAPAGICRCRAVRCRRGDASPRHAQGARSRSLSLMRCLAETRRSALLSPRFSVLSSRFGSASKAARASRSISGSCSAFRSGWRSRRSAVRSLGPRPRRRALTGESACRGQEAYRRRQGVHGAHRRRH